MYTIVWLTRLEFEIFGLHLTAVTFEQMNENQILEAPVFYSFKPELISRGAYHEHLLRMQLMKSDLRRLDFDILQRETEIDQQKLKPDFIDKARDLPIFLDLSYVDIKLQQLRRMLEMCW